MKKQKSKINQVEAVMDPPEVESPEEEKGETGAQEEAEKLASTANGKAAKKKGYTSLEQLRSKGKELDAANPPQKEAVARITPRKGTGLLSKMIAKAGKG